MPTTRAAFQSGSDFRKNIIVVGEPIEPMTLRRPRVTDQALSEVFGKLYIAKEENRMTDTPTPKPRLHLNSSTYTYQSSLRWTLGLPFRQASEEDKKRALESQTELLRAWKASGVQLVTTFGVSGGSWDGYWRNYMFDVPDLRKARRMSTDVSHSVLGKFTEKFELVYGSREASIEGALEDPLGLSSGSCSRGEAASVRKATRIRC